MTVLSDNLTTDITNNKQLVASLHNNAGFSHSLLERVTYRRDYGGHTEEAVFCNWWLKPDGSSAISIKIDVETSETVENDITAIQVIKIKGYSCTINEKYPSTAQQHLIIKDVTEDDLIEILTTLFDQQNSRMVSLFRRKKQKRYTTYTVNLIATDVVV